MYRRYVNWRSIAAGAVASAALVISGCASEGDGSHWSTDNSNNRAAPASAQYSGAQGQSSNATNARSDRYTVARAFPTGNKDSSDILVEQMGSREIRAGQPYTYQLRVTNLTNQPLTGVVLRQHVSDNFKINQNDAIKMGQENGGDAQIQVGDLGPKQSKTVDVSGTATGPGMLDTCLSAQYNPPTLCAQIAVVAPALKAMAQGPSQVDVCQDITYRYTVTNTGTGTAHNVVLQKELPEGMQTASGQRTASANVGDLAQGESKTVDVRVKAIHAGQFATRATINSDVGQIQTDPVTTNVLAPRLAVTITAPKEQVAAGNLSYRIDVKNVGDAPAVGTRLRVGATPGHVEFINAQGGQGAQLASERPGGGQDLGTIAPGDNKTVTINFKPREGGQTDFTATAEADCAQPVTTSLNTNLQTITASALVVTHDVDPVPVGGNVTYRLTVENKGNTTDRNIKVTAVLPDSLQFVRGGGKTDVRNDGQNVTFGEIPSLEPKQNVSWDVTAKALRADQADFKATMTSDSTPSAAVKIEPTKLFGGTGQTQQKTNVAPGPAGANQPQQQQPQQQQ